MSFQNKTQKMFPADSYCEVSSEHGSPPKSPVLIFDSVSYTISFIFHVFILFFNFFSKVQILISQNHIYHKHTDKIVILFALSTFVLMLSSLFLGSADVVHVVESRERGSASSLGGQEDPGYSRAHPGLLGFTWTPQ